MSFPSSAQNHICQFQHLQAKRCPHAMLSSKPTRSQPRDALQAQHACNPVLAIPVVWVAPGFDCKAASYTGRLLCTLLSLNTLRLHVRTCNAFMESGAAAIGQSQPSCIVFRHGLTYACNCRVPVRSLEVLVNGQWVPATRTDDGFFVVQDGSGGLNYPLQVRSYMCTPMTHICNVAYVLQCFLLQ